MRVEEACRRREEVVVAARRWLRVVAVRERKWRGVFRRFEAFSDESKGGRRLKEVWVTFSVPWMAWTVAGNARTEGDGAGEEEGEGLREERESGSKK